MIEPLQPAPQETIKSPLGFIEKPLNGLEPARCVDGRNATGSEQGPQMLGGSMHPILLSTINEGTPFSQETVSRGLQTLKEKGYTTGVHKGEHQHGASCDCGFCDKMKEIYRTALKNREPFTRILRTVYEANTDLLGSPGAIDASYQRFNQYSPENIQLVGAPLVAHAVANGAACETVEKDHAEEMAFVNTKRGVTLDTKRVNEQGNQVFNLDLFVAIEQAKALGVDEQFATAASLILYLATEKVLVQDKGKPALPIEVYK